jgi:hypothetical protein
MHWYRIYSIGPDDHFTRGEAIYCPSDAEALAAARRMLSNHTAVEVWQGTRKVGRLLADRQRSRFVKAAMWAFG